MLRKRTSNQKQMLLFNMRVCLVDTTLLFFYSYIQTVFTVNLNLKRGCTLRALDSIPILRHWRPVPRDVEV